MNMRVFPDHEAMSEAAATVIADFVRAKPDTLLCAASGSTPNRAYERLAAQHARDAKLFAQMRLLKLDEWGGLAMNDAATCETHLRRALVAVLGLAERYVAFDSAAPAEQECDRIRVWLAANGPIDLCVLGLGLNGHLGFNEPAEFLQPHTHVARLSVTSLQHAMLSQGSSQPTHGLTLGMAELLQARKIVLVVSGSAKQAALARLLRPEISPEFPASFLHLHADVEICCDVAAAPS